MLTNTTLLQLLFLLFMVRFEWVVMKQLPPADTGSDVMRRLFKLLVITAASPPVGILAIILTAADIKITSRRVRGVGRSLRLHPTSPPLHRFTAFTEPLASMTMIVVCGHKTADLCKKLSTILSSNHNGFDNKFGPYQSRRVVFHWHRSLNRLINN